MSPQLPCASVSEALYERLGKLGVLPVLTVERAEDAAPLARALRAGGLVAAEVTFRTPSAAEVMRIMADEGLLVGAGTVLRAEQVELAVGSGAQFVVSPGWSDKVFEASREQEVPHVPGVATASEIQAALEHGVDVVKFFPAEAMGGIGIIRALAAPFGDVRFVPTGGISEETAPGYLEHPAILAVGGSWMVPVALVRDRNWVEITRLSAATVASVAKARTGA